MSSMDADKRKYIIDGSKFNTLEEFYDHISYVFSLPSWWGRNLDAFFELFNSDFLPSQGYSIIWRHAVLSEQKLGYMETIRQLSKRLETCHPDNIPLIQSELENAHKGIGPTVFDWLIEIIRDHCTKGNETENRCDFRIE